MNFIQFLIEEQEQNAKDVEDMNPEEMTQHAKQLMKRARLKDSGREEQAKNLAMRDLRQKIRDAQDPRQRMDLQRRLRELQQESCCEEVFVDKDGNILTEATARQFKRVGKEIKRRYRCLSGPKAGKLVSEPSKCATRKDPKKIRHGRKVMRSKKGTITRKSRISKRKHLSKLVTKMNKRLSGK